MKTIYKYEIEPKNPFAVDMPKGAKLLTAAAQGETIQVWAEVDASKETEERLFETFPTGAELHEDMGVEREYLATAFMGWMVLHVYERIN